MPQYLTELRFRGQGALRRARTADAKRWRRAYWITPLFVFVFLGSFTYLLTKAVAALIAVGLSLLASRRPDRALLALFAILPFQTVLLSYLFKTWLPADVVRPLAAWKEAFGIGILIAAIRAILTGADATRRQTLGGRIRSSLDRVDFLLLAYVGLVLVFALMPRLLAPDAPIGSGTRSLGFRSTAGFVLLFFGARHTVLPTDFGSRLRKVVLVTGCTVAVVGIYEFFFSSSWNNFAIKTIQFLHYQVLVLGATPISLTDIRSYGFIGGEEVLRIGSVFFSPLVVGFYLLAAFGVGLEVVLRRGLRLGPAIVLMTIGIALIFTQTRASILGAIVVGMVAFRPLPGRPPRNRVRLALLVGAALVLLVPAAASTGLVDRATGAATGEDESADQHIDGFWRGIEAISDAPMGHGLGTSAGIGQRFGADTAIVTENYYLQVGVELGLIGTVLFLLLTISIARKLTQWSETGDAELAGARGAFIGLAVGAALLHTWTDVAVSWTAWGAAGAMLGIAERARRSRPVYDEPDPPVMMLASPPAT